MRRGSSVYSLGAPRECSRLLGRRYSYALNALVDRPLVGRPVIASFTAPVLELQCNLWVAAWEQRGSDIRESACMHGTQTREQRSHGWPAARPSACWGPLFAQRKPAQSRPCRASSLRNTPGCLRLESVRETSREEDSAPSKGPNSAIGRRRIDSSPCPAAWLPGPPWPLSIFASPRFRSPQQLQRRLQRHRQEQRQEQPEAQTPRQASFGANVQCASLIEPCGQNYAASNAKSKEAV